MATGRRRSKNYHTLPHFETEAQHVVSSFCCLLPTVDCGVLCLLPPGSACVRKTPAPVSAMLAGCRRHSTCICIFKLRLRFVCGLPLGCVYTRIADRRGCASLSAPRTSSHSLFSTLSFASLFVHLALNSCAFVADLRSATSCTSTLQSCIYVSLFQVPQQRLPDAHHRLTYLMPLDTHYEQIPVRLGCKFDFKQRLDLRD